MECWLIGCWSTNGCQSKLAAGVSWTQCAHVSWLYLASFALFLTNNGCTKADYKYWHCFILAIILRFEIMGSIIITANIWDIVLLWHIVTESDMLYVVYVYIYIFFYLMSFKCHPLNKLLLGRWMCKRKLEK